MEFKEQIILIDKPKGITSFDVIRRLRRKLGVRKMGHAGTLDPLASGLMIVAVGDGTKELSNYIKLPKEYIAEILVGERRSTGDMEGVVVEEKEVKKLDLDKEKIKKILRNIEGEIELPVPVYSAIKEKGERLYKKARKGEKVIPPKKKMRVIKAELLNCKRVEKHFILTVVFEVTSGTYIRSLAEEVGCRLGYPATIKELRRTKIGGFKVEDAEKI